MNGSVVPLNYHLENGDVVEIQKHPHPKPSPRWLTLLKTASAKSRLKRYLVTHDRPLYLTAGREALNHELAKHHLPLLDTDLTLLRLCDGKKLSLPEREEMLIKIGQGAQNAASTLQNIDVLKMPKQEQRQVITDRVSRFPVTAEVEGDVPLPLRFAKCCKPEETKGCPLAGVISRAGDVRVHCDDCTMLRTINPERKVGVRWVREIKN